MKPPDPGASSPRTVVSAGSPQIKSHENPIVALGGSVFGLALLVFEVAWLGWFLWEPLPNAGGAIRRWMLLARALPYVIPGVEPDQSYLGMALGELRQTEFLPQRLPLLFAALLIGAGATALGRIVLRGFKLLGSLDTLERLPVAFGLGASLLGGITLVVGRLGGLSPWPVRLGLAGVVVVELILSIRERRREPRTPTNRSALGFSRLGWWALLLLTGPFLLTLTLGAMLPTIDFDALEYHLQGPKEYFQAGQIRFLSHNVYTSMPFNVEMLHLLGMEVLNDWWRGALVGQLLIAVQAPLGALAIALTARRLGSERAAWIAAIVYLTTPWIYRLAILPYVEGPLCFYQATIVWLVTIAWTESDRSRRTRWWGVVGALAGGAMACKYPALISAVIPFGLLVTILAIRNRAPSDVFAYAIGCSAIMAPWLLKNVVDTGNPVYPLGFRIFGGSYWDAAMDQKWQGAHGPRPIRLDLLVRSIVDVVGRSDWQSSLYLALGPLAFVRPGSRKAAWLLFGFVAYLFLSWWLLTHRLDRFWLPLLPASAVLAGLGADWSRSRVWKVSLAALLFLNILTNFTYCTTALTGLNEWTGDLKRLRKSVPAMLNPSLATLDNAFRSEQKVLLVGQAAVFHLDQPIVYNTVFDTEIFEEIARDHDPESIRKTLTDRNIGSIYVDWHDIQRYRSPGNYGYTDFVTPEVFQMLVKAGVLKPAIPLATSQEIYQVVSDRSKKDLPR